MTPERMAQLVTRWVRFYTRDLPTPVAQRRRDEIDADVRDHIAHERGEGSSEARIALGVASRLIRGVAADTAWRRGQQKPGGRSRRAALYIALAVALVLSLPLIAMQFSNEVVWSLADFVLVGVLLTIIGVAIERAIRNAGSRTAAVSIGVLGVLAMLFGGADDAPGLVLIGIVLVASACALGIRSAAGLSDRS